MVVNFKTIDLQDQPVLVLRNADGTAIQTLGYANQLNMSLHYNETSSITFNVPGYVDGVKTPHYDDIVGMRIVEVVGWGQFVLVNPSVSKDGIKEIKQCKAYSLEYELTYKKFSLQEDSYNFWNPVAPDATALGIILSYLPSWSVGSIDDVLIGKYRTFSEDNANIYNFIKSKVQAAYGCIFDFDTYNRKINVRSVDTDCTTSQVYISLDNLAKEINVEEETEGILTRLDVNGAEGVDIRDVNPMGTNKLYNLDYFMESGHFTAEIVNKWNAWKQSFASHQLEHYNTSIEISLKITAISTEKAALTVLEVGDLKGLENSQAICVEYLAGLTDKTSDEYIKYQNELNAVNAKIESKKIEIAAQKAKIKSLEVQLKALEDSLNGIRDKVAFSNFFTNTEMIYLDRYFKEDSIQESSFVLSKVESYTDEGESNTVSNLPLVFSEGVVTKIFGARSADLYSIKSGVIKSTGNENALSANVISGSFEHTPEDDSFTLALYVGAGVLNGAKFTGGSISFTGTCNNIKSDVVPDKDNPESYATGTTMSFKITAANMFFTKNTTEYEKYAVEWELFEYGQNSMRKLAYPSFNFSVDAANFFALKEFVSFTEHLELGQKIYLDLDEGKVLQPILIGVDLDFEDFHSFQLSFSDKFASSDSVFKMVDLLEQSITMGKTMDKNRLNYNTFIDSGASTAVRDYMKEALDASKNEILSGKNMAVSWDSSGIKCRKFGASGGYEKEQIALINNSICFTDDAWQTAKMAIGKFKDATLGNTWGVAAPSIVGTLLASHNLVIESAKKDGGTSVFKVDADGAVLHNAKFDIENGTSHIVLDPKLGFGIGNYPIVKTTEGVSMWDEDEIKFWVDTSGNVHFDGQLEGCTGLFSGSLKVGGNKGFRVDTQGNLSIGGTENDPNFYVNAAGSMRAKTGTFSGTLEVAKIVGKTDGSADGTILRGSAISVGGTESSPKFLVDQNGNLTLAGNINMSEGKITWGGNSPVKYQFAVSSTGSWHDTMQTNDKYRRDSLDGGITWGAAYQFRGVDGKPGSDANVPGYIKSTFIDGNSVSSPVIRGGTISGAQFTDLEEAYNLIMDYGSATSQSSALNLKSRGGQSIFSIWEDYGGSMALRGKNYIPFVVNIQNNSTSISKPQGVWDFTECDEVKGVPARFM